MRTPLFLFFCLYSLLLISQNGKIVAGPFAGNHTSKEIKIWFLVKKAQKAHLSLRSDNQSLIANLNISDYPSFNGLHTIQYQFNNLEPNKTYELEICLDGFSFEQRYNFHTLSEDSIKDFSFLIGSCLFLAPKILAPFYPGNEDGIIKAMTKTESDFMVWLGDNVYYPLSVRKAKTMHKIYNQYRRNKAMNDFFKSRPHFATWDDHDYGRNNSRSEFELKDSALKIHENYWPNPSYGEAHNKGVYFKFRYYDAEFILLDGRYHAIRGNSQRSLMGKEQFRWFKRSIENSTAKHIFIINGIQILNRHGRFEAYERLYPEEYEAIMRIINKKQGAKFTFLSGDRHFSSILSDTLDDQSIVYDITCSPLGAPVRPYYTEGERENPQLLKGSIIDFHNYAKISLIGKGSERGVIVETYDNQGNSVWKYDTRQHVYLK